MAKVMNRVVIGEIKTAYDDNDVNGRKMGGVTHSSSGKRIIHRKLLLAFECLFTSPNLVFIELRSPLWA